MSETIILIIGLFGLILTLVVMYGHQIKKVGQNDLKVIEKTAKAKKKLEDDIERNKRMSVKSKLKWLRDWARKGQV